MPNYKYKASDKKGRLITDNLNATNTKEAEIFLKDKQLNILSINESPENKFSLNLGGKFPIQEKITMCRYLAVMINSGMSAGEAFDLLTAGTPNKMVKKVLQEISSSVRRGQSLYTSFSKYPKHFGDNFLAMVRVGETSGTLADSLQYLAKQYQQENDLRKKIVSAMLYPLIIVSLMIAMGFLMFTFVMPRLSKVFLQMNLEIPITTKFIFQMSLFMEKHFFYVLVGIIAISIALFVFFYSKIGRKLLFTLLNHLPVVKTLILQYSLVRFTQSLSSLLMAGVPVSESLEIACKAFNSQDQGRLAKNFSEKVAKGLPLSVVFAETKLFPPMMSQMLAVGERSGNLEKILADLALFYQDEVENSLKNFITILEPVLMIIVGIGVGTMIIMFISPIYSLIGKLQPK